MRLRAVRAALATLVLGSVIAAVPAGAADAASTPIVGGGSFAQTIPFIDGSLYVFECHIAAPGAVSTTISNCTLGGWPVSAPPVTSAGPAAVTEEGVSIAPQTVQVCWSGSALYSDGTTQSTSGCSTSSSLAGAGVS